MNDPGWEQQDDCERRRFDEWQELLKADPAYDEWLDFINATTQEHEHDRYQQHEL